MIIPSIDIRDGRAVQLRQGKEFVLDCGDPLTLLAELSVVGEVAVVDLDAATGTGSNRDLILEMIRRAPCRVGGGIRDRETAVEWLNRGARRIIVGTAASPKFFSGLPRDRLIAAVDAYQSDVVVEGWKTQTGITPVARIEELTQYVSGFLFTQVEFEGSMSGFDWGAVERVREAASDCRVTAAGGITTTDEIGRLDGMGVDAQVGMALYSGTLSLGHAFAASLGEPQSPGTSAEHVALGGAAHDAPRKSDADQGSAPSRGEHAHRESDDSSADSDLSGARAQRTTPAVWPTVVCDENGAALGLVWSSHESLVRAVNERAGIYWSRSRGELWVKGETSGNTQTLLRVDLDCDRDALRFTVHQHGAGFCHTGTRSCWGSDFDLQALEQLIGKRKADGDPESRTVRLLNDADLLGAKLREEAAELAEATTDAEVAHEAADVLYFTMTAMARAGVSLRDVIRELETRNSSVVRRALARKRRED